MNTQLITNLQTIIASLIAYFPMVTVENYMAAYFAELLGDETPRHHGFLSWNPMQHINPIGIIFILLFRIGFGANVPITPEFIREPHQTAKQVALFFINCIGLIIWLLLVVLCTVPLALGAECSAFGGFSSYATSIALVLRFGMAMGMVLLGLSFIMALLNCLLYFFFQDLYRQLSGQLYVIVVAIVLLHFVGGDLVLLIHHAFSYMQNWLMHGARVICGLQ